MAHFIGLLACRRNGQSLTKTQCYTRGYPWRAVGTTKACPKGVKGSLSPQN